jgi:hypothetical protein
VSLRRVDFVLKTLNRPSRFLGGQSTTASEVPKAKVRPKNLVGIRAPLISCQARQIYGGCIRLNLTLSL